MSQSRPSLLVICLIISLTSLTILHCGGAEKREPTTYAEYASLVCVEDITIGATWEQYRQYLKARKQNMENTIPPDGVAEYHLATLALLNASLEATKGKDSGATANYYEFANAPDIITFAMAFAEAAEDLSAQAWRALDGHGCPVG